MNGLADYVEVVHTSLMAVISNQMHKASISEFRREISEKISEFQREIVKKNEVRWRRLTVCNLFFCELSRESSRVPLGGVRSTPGCIFRKFSFQNLAEYRESFL